MDSTDWIPREGDDIEFWFEDRWRRAKVIFFHGDSQLIEMLARRSGILFLPLWVCRPIVRFSKPKSDITADRPLSAA